MKGYLKERLNNLIVKKLMYFINLSESIIIRKNILIF